MFERSVIQEVRRKTDFVALVGEHRPMKKQGSRWVCRCPFHEEKTGSFNVSPDVQLAVCFSCKWGGDAIRFVEHLEGMNFPEAVRFLAERAGVDLPETRDPRAVAEDRRQRDERERLLAACEVAAAFYEAQLRAAPFSELARGALEERGVTAESAGRFRLGYAPARWGGLADHLRAKGVSPADAELAGLLVPSRHGRGGYHDRFRHRLMFPVMDRAGKVVAFSGRILPMSEEMPEGIVPPDAGKYINSPETPLFTKGEHLYGVHAARIPIMQRERAILVEGNFDVVQMHQHGFTETVAPLGTAFTPEQALLLRRMADKATLVFDGDGAGRNAARTSHKVCEDAGVMARVGVLPLKQDPDSYLRDSGQIAMGRLLQQAQGMMEWLIRDAAAHVTGGAMATTSDRVVAARQLAPVLAAIRDEIEEREAVRIAANQLVLTEDAIRTAIRDHRRSVKADAAAPLPTTRTHQDRPGLTELASRNDTSEGAAKRAMAAGIEAVLYDRGLLVGEMAGRLVAHLRPPMDGVVREAVSQWSRGECLDGPTILETIPADDEAGVRLRAWTAARLIPVSDEAVLERCSMALRDAVGHLDRCREAAASEERRVQSMRASADGDRASEVDVLEAQRRARAEGIPGPRRAGGGTGASGGASRGGDHRPN